MSPCLVDMFNSVSLLALTTLDLDVRNAIADLRLVTGITLRHTIREHTMGDGAIKFRKSILCD